MEENLLKSFLKQSLVGAQNNHPNKWHIENFTEFETD